MTPDSIRELRALVGPAAAITSFCPLPAEVFTTFEAVAYQERWEDRYGLWWVWKGTAILTPNQRSVEVVLVVGHEERRSEVNDGSFWLVVSYLLKARRYTPKVGWSTDYSMRGNVAGIRVDTKGLSPLPPHWVQHHVQEAYRLALISLPAAEEILQKMSPVSSV